MNEQSNSDPGESVAAGNGDPRDRLAGPGVHELRALRKDWWWLMLLGVSLVVLGTIAIGGAFFVSVVTVIFFGVLLMIGGVGQIISAFWAGRWSGFMLQLLLGIFYVVVAMLILDQPLVSTVALTMLIAAFLIVAGIFRIVSAMVLRFPSWGWQLLSGVVALMLGLLINRLVAENDPRALLLIGIFVGIEMLFNGWTWIMLSLEVRRLPAEAEAHAAAGPAEDAMT